MHYQIQRIDGYSFGLAFDIFVKAIDSEAKYTLTMAFGHYQFRIGI